MNSITPGQLADEDLPSAAGFEGEIREFVRKDVAPWRRRQEPANEAPGESISMLVQRVAGASMNDIDTVIDELRTMRDYLRTEGERVQREVAGYATLSQTAATSMKSITESMVQWRAALSEPTYRRE